MNLLHDLKRSNVLRDGAFYVAAVWLLAQVATQILPVFKVLTWTMQYSPSLTTSCSIKDCFV